MTLPYRASFYQRAQCDGIVGEPFFVERRAHKPRRLESSGRDNANPTAKFIYIK